MTVPATDGRNLSIAAIQMDANPAPTTERLARADRLARVAAEAGAQLIVLPELFNTGYAYCDENHALVEPLDGPSMAWIRDAAARLGVHLAGSLMLLDQGEVYNALLLFAPDGRMWRYDKNYPWGWERGYFRESRREPRTTIAETDLGDIGMLLCWDVAHRHLWKQYAGRVDLMLIASCPPDSGTLAFHLPNGDRVTLDNMGLAAVLLRDASTRIFGDTVDEQTAWLGVPAVHTVGCGHIRTDIPNGRLSLLMYAFSAPWLLRYLPQANRLQMSSDMTYECKVVDASGQVLAALTREDGEAFALAQVHLPGAKPTPCQPHPAPPIPRLVYLISDTLLPAITRSVYRRGQRRWRQGGEHGGAATSAE